MNPKLLPSGSTRTYWRFSPKHKWHVLHGWNCTQSWPSLYELEFHYKAQICEAMIYTRPPGDFCKACERSAHMHVSSSIENCR